MPLDVDEGFYNRADSLINLANEHLATVGRGKVSASFMFAQARYAAWVSACGFSSGADMEAAKMETIAYFVEQFRLMLNQNIDDYVANFDSYMLAESDVAHSVADDKEP